MSLKIGLFSLKDGVGVSALSIHIANFLSSEKRVALVEKTASGKGPEYHRIKGDVDSDGTYVINNVHYYPAQKIKNDEVWPLEYEPLNIDVAEDVVIYDLGEINFMFDFPEGIDKLYLVTDSDFQNVSFIQSFYQDMIGQGNVHDFDVVLCGASRDDIVAYRDALSFVSTVIGIQDKKEERLDYTFAMRLQIFMRKIGAEVPEYHETWDYEPVAFYSEDEWIKMWRDKNQPNKSALVIQNPLKAQKKALEEAEKVAPVVKKSKIKTAKRKKVLDANVFEDFEMGPIPEPTIPEPKVKSVRPAPVIEEQGEPVTKTDDIAAIEKASEAFDPKKIAFSDDVAVPKNTSQEHIVYEHKEDESGLLGDIIEGINRGGHFCCNLFIVTRSMQLFVFDEIDTFFAKLDAVKREIGDDSNIKYALLTYNNPERKPRLFSHDKAMQKEAVTKVLSSLDNELRTKSVSEEELKEHRELLVFDEIICA